MARNTEKKSKISQDKVTLVNIWKPMVEQKDYFPRLHSEVPYIENDKLTMHANQKETKRE